MAYPREYIGATFNEQVAEMTPSQKIAFTIPEAVAYSGIGRSSLYKLFTRGDLIPRKAGKRTLILVSELEALVKNLPTGGHSDDRQ